MNPLLQAAILYANRGWPVIPLHHLRPNIRSCSCNRAENCPGPGKHPFFFKWKELATTDIARITSWWKVKPLANIGLTMGGAHNLVCIDIDGVAGRESLKFLEEQYGDLPITLTQSTGRQDSGEHRIFHTDGIQIDRIRNRAKIAPGIDLKSAGGLIVAAPSKHASGATYAWHDIQTPVAELPAWMIKIAISIKARQAATLDPSAQRPHEEDLPYPHDDRIEMARESLMLEGRPAIQGQNGSAACLHAALLLIRGWCLSQDAALKILVSDYNPICLPPWSEDELMYKCKSAEYNVQAVPWRYKMSNEGGAVVDAIIAAAHRELDPRRKRTPEELEQQRRDYIEQYTKDISIDDAPPIDTTVRTFQVRPRKPT